MTCSRWWLAAGVQHEHLLQPYQQSQAQHQTCQLSHGTCYQLCPSWLPSPGWDMLLLLPYLPYLPLLLLLLLLLEFLQLARCHFLPAVPAVFVPEQWLWCECHWCLPPGPSASQQHRQQSAAALLLPPASLGTAA
jgi:hypothetical protein